MNKFKERRNLAWQGITYSTQRFDLLIVSICGAGIYVSLETIKYSIELYDINTIILPKLAGLFFVFGIMSNFLSQIFGKKANYNDYLMCEAEIDKLNESGESEKKKLENESKDYDEKSEKFSKRTKHFNTLSMILMFIAMILTTIFFMFFLY